MQKVAGPPSVLFLRHLGFCMLWSKSGWPSPLLHEKKKVAGPPSRRCRVNIKKRCGPAAIFQLKILNFCGRAAVRLLVNDYFGDICYLNQVYFFFEIKAICLTCNVMWLATVVMCLRSVANEDLIEKCDGLFKV